MSQKLSKKDLIKTLESIAATKGLNVLNKSHKDEVMNVVFDAFSNDPIPEYLSGIKDSDPEKNYYKTLLMKFMFGWMITDIISQKTGVCLGINDMNTMVGIIAVVPSGCDKKESFFTILRRFWQNGVPPTMKKKTKKHYHPLATKRLEAMEAVEKRRFEIMKERGHQKYIYIGAVGVKTTSHGHGYGGRLLRSIFDAATELNVPLYLETETKENEALYKHLGFQTIEIFPIIVPGDDVTQDMYLMLRN